MATIRDPNPIKLGEFHTVELYRNHTLGYIIVDGGEPINGSSQVIVSVGMNSILIYLCMITCSTNAHFLSLGQVPGAGPE